MMTRNGRVVGERDGQLVVRFERASACGGCHAAKVCGSAQTSELLFTSAGCASQAGDEVRVELDTATALRAVANMYLLPVAGLILGMALAALLGLSDIAIAAFSFCGVGLGLLGARRLAQFPAFTPEPRLAPSRPDREADPTEPDHLESSR